VGREDVQRLSAAGATELGRRGASHAAGGQQHYLPGAVERCTGVLRCAVCVHNRAHPPGPDIDGLHALRVGAGSDGDGRQRCEGVTHIPELC